MSKSVKYIPGEMTEVDVNFLSLVRKGANGQRVQIYKADDAEPESDEAAEPETEKESSLYQALKSFFIKSDAVTPAKSPKRPTSFADAIAVSDIMDGMWRVNDTLREIMRNIIGDENVTNKKTALEQAIDDYSAYMKKKISAAGIAKSADFIAAEPVEKAGRVLSSKNAAAIRDAITAVNALKALLETTDAPEAGEKGESEEMKKEDITAAVTEAIKPLAERMDSIEKAMADPETSAAEQPESGSDSGEKDTDAAAIVKAALEDAIKPLSERLERVEKSRGLPRSGEGEEKNPVQKEDAAFDGFFAAEQ